MLKSQLYEKFEASEEIGSTQEIESSKMKIEWGPHKFGIM